MKLKQYKHVYVLAAKHEQLKISQIISMTNIQDTENNTFYLSEQKV